ncbi:MAG: Holliday junction branch migration protein RuvA [Chloroflexi bacterium]|nr:Holliday junction branch migration protein RuvA [Chloroflexota bacterium]
MIAAVRGRVRRCAGNEVVIGIGPLDLRVMVPTTTASRLSPGLDAELYTHFALQPDQRGFQMALYGFESAEALSIFELLITVSGVGPKGALGLLSGLDANELRTAIIAGDQRALTRAPGIGPRVAARIAGELSERIAAVPLAGEESGSGYAGALEALTNLGYSLVDARQALSGAPPNESAEGLVRLALAFLGRR